MLCEVPFSVNTVEIQTQWRPLRKTLTSELGLYVFGLARRGSTIGFRFLWHTVELAMSARLCLF